MCTHTGLSNSSSSSDSNRAAAACVSFTLICTLSVYTPPPPHTQATPTSACSAGVTRWSALTRRLPCPGTTALLLPTRRSPCSSWAKGRRRYGAFVFAFAVRCLVGVLCGACGWVLCLQCAVLLGCSLLSCWGCVNMGERRGDRGCTAWGRHLGREEPGGRQDGCRCACVHVELLQRHAGSVQHICVVTAILLLVWLQGDAGAAEALPRLSRHACSTGGGTVGGRAGG